MRRRGVVWPTVFCALAGVVSLTDGFTNLPLLAVLGLFIVEGSATARVKALLRDRVFLAGIGTAALGIVVDVLIGLAARQRGTDLTLMGYVLLRAGHGSLIPSRDVWVTWAGVIDLYFPYRGTWLAMIGICVLAVIEGARGRLIGFVAVWWVLASMGLIRYLTGLGSMGRPVAASWLNASGGLAVPSFLLVAWFIASIGDGILPAARRIRPRVRGALAVALWLTLIPRLAWQADLVAFGDPDAFHERRVRGLALDQLSQPRPKELNKCRTIKATAFYARSHAPGVPYVFLLSSSANLGPIGEFYYGLSYARGSRPEDPNHLLDFGATTGQYTKPHSVEEFAHAYGVDHFDFYIDFVQEHDPVKAATLDRLTAAGAQVVCIIRDGDRPIGRILSFSGDQPIDLDARAASASWDARFGRARTLLMQPLAGTAYHFGYNWRSLE
jgi:hypothetical protein